LLAARQRLRTDTRAGLRLLDEHRERFGDGQLAPEREVLAIEVMRKLGQTDAANRRFAAFRARYPNSLHMQRLEQMAR
jgi:TolA-binding protein